MTTVKFIPIAIYTGVLGACVQIIDILIHGFVPPVGNAGLSWIAFLAWATYFMSGCTVRGGIKAMISMVVGALLSCAIITLAGVMPFLGVWAVPAAIVCLVPLTIMLERCPDIVSAVAPVFIGAGAFFGCINQSPDATLGQVFAGEAVYCLIGLFFGWLTIVGRSWYTARVTAAQDA